MHLGMGLHTAGKHTLYMATCACDLQIAEYDVVRMQVAESKHDAATERVSMVHENEVTQRLFSDDKKAAKFGEGKRRSLTDAKKAAKMRFFMEGQKAATFGGAKKRFFKNRANKMSKSKSKQFLIVHRTSINDTHEQTLEFLMN